MKTFFQHLRGKSIITALLLSVSMLFCTFQGFEKNIPYAIREEVVKYYSCIVALTFCSCCNLTTVFHIFSFVESLELSRLFRTILKLGWIMLKFAKTTYVKPYFISLRLIKTIAVKIHYNSELIKAILRLVKIVLGFVKTL